MENDSNLQSSYIVKAHEVLNKGLKQLLGFKDTDLGTYLSYLIYKRTEPFVDEYGHVIRVYISVSLHLGTVQRNSDAKLRN